MTRAIFIAICLLWHVGLAWAYKEPTHESLSATAYNNSTLVTEPSFLKNLGLDPATRPVTFPNSKGETQTVEDLIKFGAYEEDSGIRSLNHFFDPRHDIQLLEIPGLAKSPDWILEDRGELIVFGLSQAFSYKEAQQYFAEALRATTQGARDNNWGKTFESLGHVIHHIQDMAQPQHVRNDQHLDNAKFWPVIKQITDLIKDPSWYEDYSFEKSKANVLIPQTLNYEPPKLATARDYWTSGTVARGEGLADFTNRNFLTKDTNFRYRGGQALVDAEYPSPQALNPNAGRVESLGLLLPGDDDGDGKPDGAALCEKLRSDPRYVFPAGGSCDMELFETSVWDAYEGTTKTNSRASSLSVFDQYLRDVDGRVQQPIGAGQYVITDRVFTLNRINFDAAHQFLIPRAIAYSTGLINHFFRGRMKLDQPAEAEDGRILEVVIRNVSSQGNSFSSGTFSLHYEATDGTRKPATILSGESIQSSAIAPDGRHTLRAQVPPDLDLLKEQPFTLVFDGVIGQERGIAGLVFDAHVNKTGFILSPSATPPDGIRGKRLITNEDSGWRLYPQGGLSAGEIDWKGRYRNGVPTRVLSWGGPVDRYFGSVGYSYRNPGYNYTGTLYNYANDGFGTGIYQEGRIFSKAPCTVLGAALQTDPTGQEWLVVICTNGDQDAVYRRPATYNLSSALYHSKTAPTGWKKIAAFPNPPELEDARRAWFFNGDGTQAQTMRAFSDRHQIKLTRLQITTAGDTAALTNLGNTYFTETSTGSGRKYGCYGGGIGNREWDITTQTKGETVVAVDYVDSVERVAKLNISNNRTSVFAGYSSGQEISSSTHTSLWQLVMENTAIEIDRGAGKSSYDVQGGNYTGSSTGFMYRSLILFLDIRSQLAVTRLEGQESAVQRTPERISTTKTLSTKYWQTFRNNQQAIYAPARTTYTNTSSGIAHYNNWGCEPEDEGPSDFSSSRELFYSLPIIWPNSWYAKGHGGAVAVDRSGNALVSFYYPDENGRQRSFDYLSSGDLPTVMGVNAPFYAPVAPY